MATPTAWIGQDGNLYYGSGSEGSGVNNLGAWNGNYEYTNGGIRSTNFDTALGQGSGFMPGVTMIDDPNAPQRAPSGGGTAPARPVLDQAAVSNTQQTIDQIPGLLEAALQAERQRYGNTVGEFNQQEQGQRKTYEGSTVTNQQNYDANFMDSIRAGIKGLGGLMQLLRGTGAAGGTAETMAQDTVGGVTSNDIRTGADTQKENQVQLDSSLGSFLTELQRKRKANDDVLVNNERAVRRDSTTQLQDLFGKMAGYYGAAKMKPNRVEWMNRAGALTPEIAANSRTQVSNYDTAPVAVKAPELTAFAGPTQPNVLAGDSEERGRVGSGIFTIGEQRRRKEQAPVGV
jgi:hypothetical protein